MAAAAPAPGAAAGATSGQSANAVLRHLPEGWQGVEGRELRRRPRSHEALCEGQGEGGRVGGQEELWTLKLQLPLNR